MCMQLWKSHSAAAEVAGVATVLKSGPCLGTV